MKISICVFVFFLFTRLDAQIPVNLENFHTGNGTQIQSNANDLSVTWPAGKKQKAQLVFSLKNNEPLFQQINISGKGKVKTIAKNLDPAFLLTVGKRDLVFQNGWNIFFDKVPLKPFQAYRLALDKTKATVRSNGSRTIITIGNMTAPGFNGELQITLYNGSPLFNIAAVVSTEKDSTAIIYDAGMVSRELGWKNISWSSVGDNMQTHHPSLSESSSNEAVKYRTIMGSTNNGTLAVFPPPHQYFYPLDEAFNLRFTWYGNSYRNMVPEYGIGIRQDLYGDKRFVPWFNAPPFTNQRLNFFCLISENESTQTLAEVKRFTHNDAYLSLQGYKRMSSHFHNEFVMRTMLPGKPIPDIPSFMKVFESIGIDIVHLGEFHYTAHPKGPDSLRLKELHALFEMCNRFSSNKFLLLPGEEPNEFFGGHWLEFFPKPVYWIMSRKEEQPFVSEHPVYGTVYHISSAAEMLDLLKRENGLAWTAHPRTKGSIAYPDKYKTNDFFVSDRFLGAAWKAMPADLSQPRLGKRALDLLDDMNNWGLNKKVLAEADLFTIEPENEMYAHLNVNYLQLNKLPAYNDGWQSVLDVLQRGKFFSTTGEVLIPSFTVNSTASGDTARLLSNKKAAVSFSVNWTFPLQFAEVISGDGKDVFRNKIDLDATQSFGEQTFKIPIDLKDRKWVRLEVWDVAANGAFTQTIWLH